MDFPFCSRCFHPCCVFRLAGRMASRVVALFLDGDVSFLPDNSFPSHLQLLKVSGLLQYCCPSIRVDCFNIASVSFSRPWKMWLLHCLFRRSQVTLGGSPSWSVCSWHVCVRYLAAWVSKLKHPRQESYALKVWAEVCVLLSRWRCPRLSGCYHSWKRWAAPVPTSCPTPQLLSALLAWLTRDRRVSLCSHPRLHLFIIFFLPSIRWGVCVLQVILWTDWSEAQWRECAAN